MNRYGANNFKENRVGIVVSNLTVENYQTCSDYVFYMKAEEQGTVFTLKGFAEYLNSGEYMALYQQQPSTNYVIVRFMPVFENKQEVYLNTEEYMYKDYQGLEQGL